MKSSATVRTEAISETIAHLRALAAQREPIVCGPWMSEIGFELLYWIPFLRWAIEAAGLDRDRLVILSRGGCASWYADLTPHYVDAFDAFTPQEWRALNQRRVREQSADRVVLRRGHITAKQYVSGAVDREILERVGLGHAAVLHPSLMYTLFRLQWRQRVADIYQRCARLTRLAVPSPVIDGSYVAVKFYSSQACAETDLSRAHVARIVRTLAKSSRVVVLDSGDAYDDHGSFGLPADSQVIRVPLEPRTNLAVQTSVIGHAQAFVGTYGGFAYLAPLLGVPTASFYATRNFRSDHLLVAQQQFSRFRVRFDVMDLSSSHVCAEWCRRWANAA